MARRLTAEEKGKGLVSEAKEPHIKRIRAPPMDTSALIEENSLTLIGRLTNPREQRMWALIPSLPYHFGYWMVILQRWKPVISESFPSLIPFWIRIKGLPLHFWQDAMIFEYERLESHSSKCLLLSHKSEHCPSVEAVESLKEGPPPENDLKMGEQLIEAHSDYQARNYSPRRGPDIHGALHQ